MSTPEVELERVTDSPVVESAPTNTLAGDLATAFAPTQVAEPIPPAVVPPVVEPAPVEATPSVETPVIAEPPAEPTPPNYLTEITRFAGLPLAEALPQSVAKLKEFAAYDPKAEEMLFQTVYAANKADIHAIALREMGIEQGTVKQFTDWIAAGAQALPMPAVLMFPEPNAENKVKVGGYEYDLNIEADREEYEDKKALHELKADKAQREAREAEALRVATAQAQTDAAAAIEKQRTERHTSFMDARMAEIEKQFRASQIQLAPEDQWLETLIIAGVFRELGQDKAITKLHNDADDYVKSGAGRTAEFAAAIDRENRRVVTDMLDKFNRFILRGNQAQKTVAATSPVLPEGTRKVVVEPPATPTQNPVTAQEANRIHLASVRDALANAFPTS